MDLWYQGFGDLRWTRSLTWKNAGGLLHYNDWWYFNKDSIIQRVMPDIKKRLNLLLWTKHNTLYILRKI